MSHLLKMSFVIKSYLKLVNVIIPFMIETLLSFLFIYLFIVLGYLAKAIYKEQVDSRTLTIMSVYFLQPFVTVWGFSTAKLETEHFYVSLVYLGIILLLLLPMLLVGRIPTCIYMVILSQ